MTFCSTIRLDDVGHHFLTDDEEIHLFDQLSLVLAAGEVSSIVGASGTGKSSLLAIAAGLEDPKRGTITYTVNGSSVSNAAFRKHSGFIFQHFHLLPEMDALNNLALPLRLKGATEAFDKAHEWLELIGLADRANHKPSQLSGGEQQRIAIARAFIGKPEFIFADEPTGNLDQKTAAAISELMLSFAEETGCGLVIVTHSAELAGLADCQFRLDNRVLERVR